MTNLIHTSLPFLILHFIPAKNKKNTDILHLRIRLPNILGTPFLFSITLSSYLFVRYTFAQAWRILRALLPTILRCDPIKSLIYNLSPLSFIHVD